MFPFYSSANMRGLFPKINFTLKYVRRKKILSCYKCVSIKVQNFSAFKNWDHYVDGIRNVTYYGSVHWRHYRCCGSLHPRKNCYCCLGVTWRVT